MTAPWDRHLWGVMCRTGMPGAEPMLLGSHWYGSPRVTIVSYPGEPTRALLFFTRHAARAWCAGQNLQWRERSDGMNRWRVRAVRVTETVRVKP